MIREVRTVSPEMDLGDVIRLLLEHRISIAPVIEIANDRFITCGL